VSHERNELAFRQSAFGDSRNPLQYLGFRYSLRLSRLDDQPPEADVQRFGAKDPVKGVPPAISVHADFRSGGGTLFLASSQPGMP
jgi:hypothetical protein